MVPRDGSRTPASQYIVHSIRIEPFTYSLANTYNYTQGTNSIHPRKTHGTTITKNIRSK